MDSEFLFRAGIACVLIVLICDVVIAWALYVFLEQVNKSLALLMAWLRLVYVAMLAIALLNLVIVLLLLSGDDYLAGFGTDQLHAQVLLFLNAYTAAWALGLIVFGVHLLVLGYLVLRSDYVPSILGIVLIIAGLGYPAEHLTKLLFPSFDVPFSKVVGWGELLLVFWLLWKGGRRPAEVSPAPASA